MTRNLSYISRTEQVLIVIVAGLLVLFVYGEFFSDIINTYNYEVRRQQSLLNEQAGGKGFIDFGPPSNSTGLFHLMSLFVFFALIWGRKFYVAFVLTVAYFVSLFYSHYMRFRDIESALMGWKADSLNLVVLAFLLVLVVWITSIGFRSVLQAKPRTKLD